MTESSVSLAGKRILVVEDEYFVADDISRALRRADADVVGPVATVAAGLKLAEIEPLDGAILDVNLGGEMSFPIADCLIGRNVPFAIASGYDEPALPDRLKGIASLAKPFLPHDAVALLGRLSGGQGV